MYIKINKENVRVGSVLNGEPIIIIIDKITNNDDSLFINTTTYREADTFYSTSIAIDQIGNKFAFGTNLNINTYTAAKLIKDYIIQIYPDILDNEIVIYSDKVWREELRLIRLYIPYTCVIENTNYNSLITSILDAETPFYKGLDGYILYLEEIYTEHLTVLENDPNILIENK